MAPPEVAFAIDGVDMPSFCHGLCAATLGLVTFTSLTAAADDTVHVSDSVAPQDHAPYAKEALVASLAVFETDPLIIADILAFAELDYLDSYTIGTQETLLATKLDSDGKRVVIVAFAGTEGMQDALRDLTFAPVAPTPGSDLASHCPPSSGTTCKVHKGFEAYASSVDLASLVAAYSSSSTPQTRVIFTGHSLGGALAQLIAAHTHAALLEADSGVIDRVITFGGPMVGNAAFRDAYESPSVLNLGARTHRFIFSGDPIASGLGMPISYEHAGPRHFMALVGEHYELTTPPWYYFPKDLTKHKLINYFTALWDLLDETPPPAGIEEFY